MSILSKNYFSTYGLPIKFVEDLTKVISNQNLHIFGATGALGLSLLEVLNQYKIKPQSLTLYVRGDNFQNWTDYCNKNKLFLQVKSIDVESDMCDISEINERSTVIYFIGSAQPQKFMSNPYSLFQINVSMLSKIIKKTPGYLFYSSTAEIYTGISEQVDESTSPVSTPEHPRAAYIESKRCGEAIINTMARNTKAVSFRIALATPPHQLDDDNRILADLVRMAKKDKKIYLRGGWDSVRQYQWGPVCVAKILWLGYFGKYNLYNVSGGEVISLEVLAKKIAEYYSVPYFDNKNGEILNLSAPKHVEILSKRLKEDFNYDFPIEKINDLISVYSEELE